MRWMIKSSCCILVLLVLGACSGDPYQLGASVFNEQCASCHMTDGSGLGQEIPQLQRKTSNPRLWSCLIRYGVEKEREQQGVTYTAKMPAHPQLNASEIANVINFIQSRWVEEYRFVRLDSVNIWLRECREY